MDKPEVKEDVAVEEKPKAAALNGAAKGDADKHEPKEGSPRWNEIYRKMKDTEREKEELRKDLDALRKHSRDMAERMESLAKEKADRPKPPAPNPAEDPEGYRAWVDNNQTELQKSWSEQLRKTQNENMIMMMHAMYDDYEENAAIAERDMENDPKLREEIYSKANPFKAGYEYGKKKKGASSAPKPVDVESAGDIPPSGDESEDELSEIELRTARNLWPGMPVDKLKEKYVSHKKAMGIKPRGGR